MNNSMGADDVVVGDTSVDNNESSHPLTDSQEKTLGSLSLISGTLSICGSSLIMARVLRKLRHGKASPYERIMLGLSGCDIVASFAFLLGPFLPPADTSDRVWAIGNTATCTLLGTLTQFAFSAIVYNGVLAYYYLWTVRFGVKRQVFACTYEPWMHGVTLVYFIGTAIAGASIGLYDETELGAGCWIKNYPDGCETTDTCISQYIAWAFAGFPFLFVMISLPIINVTNYCYVRTLLVAQRSSATTNATTNLSSTMDQGGGSKNGMPPTRPTLNYSPNGNTTAASTTCSTSTTNVMSQIQTEHIREVATQGFLYVVSFLVCWCPAFVLKVLESEERYLDREGDLFGLLVSYAILPPLQGAVNAWIYIRPNWTRIRAAYPEESAWSNLRRAAWDPTDVPRFSTLARQSSNLHASFRRNHNQQHPHHHHQDQSPFAVSANHHGSRTPRTSHALPSGRYSSELGRLDEEGRGSESNNSHGEEGSYRDEFTVTQAAAVVVPTTHPCATPSTQGISHNTPVIPSISSTPSSSSSSSLSTEKQRSVSVVANNQARSLSLSPESRAKVSMDGSVSSLTVPVPIPTVPGMMMLETMTSTTIPSSNNVRTTTNSAHHLDDDVATTNTTTTTTKKMPDFSRM